MHSGKISLSFTCGTPIEHPFSEYLGCSIGVPQGSVLGPILFNVYTNDLLLSVTESDICNFADDDTLHACRPTIPAVICQLKL